MTALSHRSPRPFPAATALVAALASTLGLLAGCSDGLSVSAFQPPTATAVAHLSGNVHGGQQPISGATVQLYAAGTSGNASAATPLISKTVLTDANGDFNFTNDYSCAGDPMVYLVALGGNPSSGSSIDNTAIAQMAVLGDCDTLQANAAHIFINVNELTTVASVYALSGFLSTYDHVGYAANNRTGFANAVATFNALVSIGSGQPQSSSSAVTLPSATLISLANSVSACVNSSGPGSVECSNLLADTTPAHGTAPADEVAALANLAHNPTLGGTALFNLSPTNPPFSPGLTAAPADWTLPIRYTGGGLSLPNGIALDPTGNAWIANEGGNAVTEIATAALLSGPTAYTSTAIAGAQAIAADASGNLWLANTQANSVLELNGSGAVVNTLTTGISGPVALAFDLSGNLWVANFTGNSLAEFTPTGSPVSGSPFTNAALLAPTGLAVDTSNNIWVTSSVPGTVALFSNAGVFQNTFTDNILVAPGGLAIDPASSHLWIAATGIDGLSALSINAPAMSATALTNSPFAGGTLQQPLAVALDSTGTVWTLNTSTSGSLAAFDTSGNSLFSGAYLGSLNQPINLAVDASGNLWTTSAGDNSVTEFVGLAAPTVTPVTTNLINAAAHPTLGRVSR
jgi:sugar lactone lactonase YvrE